MKRTLLASVAVAAILALPLGYWVAGDGDTGEAPAVATTETTPPAPPPVVVFDTAAEASPVAPAPECEAQPAPETVVTIETPTAKVEVTVEPGFEEGQPRLRLRLPTEQPDPIEARKHAERLRAGAQRSHDLNRRAAAAREELGVAEDSPEAKAIDNLLGKPPSGLFAAPENVASQAPPSEPTELDRLLGVPAR